MRDFHKAGWGLAAGVGLMLGLAGTALADDPRCDCGDQKERQGNTASPPGEEQQGASTTPPEGIAGKHGIATGQQGGEQQGYEKEGVGSFKLGPLVGQSGPTWSPVIGGGQGMGVGVGPSMGGEQRAFGAGLGGQGSFGVAPLPGVDIGSWSPATGIGPRAFGNIGH